MFGLLTLSSVGQLVDNLRDEGESTFITVVSAVVPPLWCWLFGYAVWQLVTRRPVIRVDGFGIHYGSSKRARLSWGNIASIGDPVGRWLFAFLNVRPVDGKPRRLPISYLHVDDLQSFAGWLRCRLEEQRALAAAADRGEPSARPPA
ncbi:hypothetical protein [Kribbella italica]|uniref:PH domain-containing protein n=1 Tax=Kribbella italica TaxID=1540520 RepID=A0A7W9J7K6_9ACTN|nr:hypothetical protein [Kribbella italica]MBB5836590.1 hypothetical protein [Kribbella italica]